MNEETEKKLLLVWTFHIYLASVHPKEYKKYRDEYEKFEERFE